MKLIVLPFLLSAVLSSANDIQETDAAVYKFQNANSLCGVAVMDIANGEIIYIYNSSLVTERKLPPGSIAKPWSALVLLKHADRTNNNQSLVVNCLGRYYGKFTDSASKRFNLPADETGRRYFSCSLKAGHGNTNMRKAICESCNTWFLTAVSDQADIFFSLLVQGFALEKGTGARLLKYADSEFKPIFPVEEPFVYAASAIGEGGAILVTPLKSAQIYAGIFNGGKMPEPYQPPLNKSEHYHMLGFSQEAIEEVYAALRETASKGTLKGLKPPAGVQLFAGKTGTATRRGEKYKTHGWNVLHIGHNKKEYVLVSFVNYGSGTKEALQLSQIVLNVLFR